MSFAVDGICKTFAGVPILRDVDLAVGDGEIHALLGANGAGKSTLIKCISGAHCPDRGHIVIGTEAHASLTPKEARRAGVFVIYQDLSLAASLDVSDNIFLGQELRFGPFIRRWQQRRKVQGWLDQLGVDLDPQADLSELSNAQLQIIEIIKALQGNPKVLILDEPTSSLTDAETQQLSDYLRMLKKQRIPILYVTHRLGEVFALADRVSVLRGGAVVLSELTKHTSHEELVGAIVGRGIEAHETGLISNELAHKPPLLRADGLLSAGIGPISFELRGGEVLGVYGLTGSGRTELLETLFGARKMFGGMIELDGHSARLSSPTLAVTHGIALVPSDRLRKSIWGTLTALENTLMPRFNSIARGGVRYRAKEIEQFLDVAKRLDLQPLEPNREARRFSGGNQQKLVLGRWLQKNDNARILLLDEPTQGVDVGARTDLYAALRKFVSNPDKAVIVTSSEPEELALLAGSVVVLAGGQMVGTFKAAEVTELNLLRSAQTPLGRSER